MSVRTSAAGVASSASRAAAPTSSDRELRRLQPLTEKIGELPAYGNQNGHLFTARLETATKRAKIDITEITDGTRKPYQVTADLCLSDDSILINSIENNSGFRTLPPPPERKGCGFFSIIVEMAEGLARKLGKKLIEIPALGEDHVAYYGSFGFSGRNLMKRPVLQAEAIRSAES